MCTSLVYMITSLLKKSTSFHSKRLFACPELVACPELPQAVVLNLVLSAKISLWNSGHDFWFHSTSSIYYSADNEFDLMVSVRFLVSQLDDWPSSPLRVPKVDIKIKVGMEWASEFEALHSTSQHKVQCNPTTKLHSHNSTALRPHYSISLQCIVLTTPNHQNFAALHCTHYSAPPLLHWHCTATHILHWISLPASTLCPHYSTALHYTVLTILHHTTTPQHLASLQPHYSTEFNCTASTTQHHHYSTTLHHHNSTALRFTATPPLHWILLHFIHYTAPPLLHCTLLLHCTALYDARHQHCMPLHFTAWRSAIHCNVFYCTSSALHVTARCSVTNWTLFNCTVQGSTLHCNSQHFTSTALYTAFYCMVPCSTFHFTDTSLYGAVHFTKVHSIIMYFTALHSLHGEGSHMHLNCDHDNSHAVAVWTSLFERGLYDVMSS